MVVLRVGTVAEKEIPKIYSSNPQKVDEIKFDTEMILARLDAVKKQVDET